VGTVLSTTKPSLGMLIVSSRVSSCCRSKDFACDVLMMPYDRDVLTPYENALLKFNSRQKNPRIQDTSIKRISRVLGRELQIETAKGLTKKFKQKCLFQEIYSLIIDYQRM